MNEQDKLISILERLSYPKALALSLCELLKTDKSIDRLISYILEFKPTRLEDIVDEALAIVEEKQKWIDKKTFEYTNGKYNEWLNERSIDEE